MIILMIFTYLTQSNHKTKKNFIHLVFKESNVFCVWLVYL